MSGFLFAIFVSRVGTQLGRKPLQQLCSLVPNGIEQGAMLGFPDLCILTFTLVVYK